MVQLKVTLLLSNEDSIELPSNEDSIDIVNKFLLHHVLNVSN